MNTVVLREGGTRSFKRRYFVETSGVVATHVSSLHGGLVRSIIFDKGSVEYYLEPVPEVLRVYEVVFSGEVTDVVVYEVSSAGLKQVGKTSLSRLRISSGFTAVDRLVREAFAYRCTWTSVLCGSMSGSVDYYAVDMLARGAVNYTLYRRLKEQVLELSREYTGFTLALLVNSVRRAGFNRMYTQGDFCSRALQAEPVSWRSTKVVLSSMNKTVEIEVEKRIGALNPDVYVKINGRSMIVECKTGPPKAWLSKAIKQAKLYREHTDLVFLITPRPLPKDLENNLTQYYSMVLYCSPDNAEKCSETLAETILHFIQR
ncbi:MAG: hypothetical protein QXY11_05305 [Desulfurococcaceae archaeon]